MTSRRVSCSRSTAPTSAGSAPTRRCSSAPRSSSTSTTITTTRASEPSISSSRPHRRPPRSSTSCWRALDVPLTPDIAEALYVGVVTDTGRFQYANTTPKALRLAAELVEAGADVHGVFKQVYETVQFAKLKLLARALERAQVYEGGRLVVSYLLASDFAEVGAVEPYSEGIIDYLRQTEGAELAALIREPPTRRWAQAPRLAALEPRRDRRLCDRAALAAAAATGRRQASRARTRSRGSSTSSAGSSSPRHPRASPMPPRASRPIGVALVDKPAGPSSFALVAALRHRTGARTGHTGTLDPFATGLLVLLSGLATRLAPCFVGLDKRYITEIDLTATTSTGDREGDLLERHPSPPADELEQRLARLRGEVELPIPAASAVKIGGERAYRLARAGIEVEMPLRRSLISALDVIAYSGDTVELALHVSSGTYVRSVAAALGGHCTALRRTAVGPFGVEEATDVLEASRALEEEVPPRMLAVSAALARLPADALARVPASVRAQVLALEARPEEGDAGEAAAAPAGAGVERAGHERRARAVRARASAPRGRDRHVRRRAPRPPGGDPGGDRRRAGGDGGHLPPAPARGARLRGRAALDARTAARTAGRARRRGDARRRVHAGGREARARDVRALVPAGDRRRARDRGSLVSLRASAGGETSGCSSRSGCRRRSSRCSRASRRPRSGAFSPPATSAPRRGCSGVRPRSRESSSRATHEEERSAFRPRISAPIGRCSSRRSGSTRVLRGIGGPPSRSASTPTTAAPNGVSRRSSSTSTGDLYGQRVVVELWERLRDEAAFSSEAELVEQIARDVAATRAATPPLPRRSPSPDAPG